MSNYGSLPPLAPPARSRRSNAMVIYGVAASGILAVTTLVVYSSSLGASELVQKGTIQIAHDFSGKPVPVPTTVVDYQQGTRAVPSSPFENSAMDKARMVQLAQKKPAQWVYDWSGQSVPVPKTAVNFQKGTRASVPSEYENDAMDKARTVQLAQKKTKWAYDWSGQSVPVPKTIVNFEKGTRASAPSEFENSSMDKARTVQLAQKQQLRGRVVSDFSGQQVMVPQLPNINYDAGTVVSPPSEFQFNAMDKARTVQLAQKPAKWVYDWSGQSVPVPRTAVNFQKGTRASAPSEFENDAMDKARTVQLSAGDARDDREMTQYSKHCMGDLCADETLDNGLFDSPAVDVAHAKCNKDTDPDCQTSIEPLLEKQSQGSTTALKFSGRKARKAFDQYFAAQKSAAEAKPTPKKPVMAQHHHVVEQPPKHGVSTAKADADLAKYFASQSKLAATPRTARKPSSAVHKAKEAAPKFGMSGAAARKDATAYFAQQQSLEEEEEEKPHHHHATVEHVGEVPADVTLDKPLWNSGDDTIDDVDVSSDKADCGDDIECQTSRSPLLYKDKHAAGLSTTQADEDLAAYFKQEQELAEQKQVPRKPAAKAKAVKEAAPKFGLSGKQAREDATRYFAAKKQALYFGVGAMDDSSIEVGKAQGVDALMPESVFGENPAPAQENLDEVNMAIQDQRNEGYSNGEGAPAEDVVVP